MGGLAPATKRTVDSLMLGLPCSPFATQGRSYRRRGTAVGAALCREMRAQPSPAHSQPYTIPVRILASTLYQSGTDWVGYDVSSNGPDVLLTP
ncbi:hypothetical protein D3C79_952470 [compost metagenome]